MEIFHTIEYTSFELLGFYKYRVIKQNVHGGYLWTNYIQN